MNNNPIFYAVLLGSLEESVSLIVAKDTRIPNQ